MREYRVATVRIPEISLQVTFYHYICEVYYAMLQLVELRLKRRISTASGCTCARGEYTLYSQTQSRMHTAMY